MNDSRTENSVVECCEYCGFCLVVAGPRKCCRAGKDVDRLRAQLEVAEAGYMAAVQKAEWQARTNHELNELERKLRGSQAFICSDLNGAVAAAAAQPTLGSWGVFCGEHGYTEWRTECPKCISQEPRT